jgi:D-alanyl-D-alanine carboxypeptidase
MNKKSLLGLILFSCLVLTGLFWSANFLTNQNNRTDEGIEQSYTNEDNLNNSYASADTSEKTSKDDEPAINSKDDKENNAGEQPQTAGETVIDIEEKEPWLSSNPSDQGGSTSEVTKTPTGAPKEDETEAGTFVTSINTYQSPQLIYDCNIVDYKAYIPDMVFDSQLEVALDINNPDITIDAESAILFDANTNKVLYYKDAVQAMFPASTAKLLTSLVALEWCKEEEEVTIGDEVTMIASDSTRAYLKQGEVLTIRNLLEGMLLPSGNDAAYAVAAYVGRKSLEDKEATKEEAVAEFMRLMNEKADSLGVKNSCFKTPDGYDAIGQYTTAYDMGLIGVAAANNASIVEVSKKGTSRNIFVSGEDITWENTNRLIKRYSGQYYSKAIGLKTGTSTMAGRSIIAAAEDDGKKVVCVILNSTSEGRWEDAIELLEHGLK